MHQCQCGGVIRQHPLTNGREAWTCNECGRYQAVAPRTPIASDLFTDQPAAKENHLTPHADSA